MAFTTLKRVKGENEDIETEKPSGVNRDFGLFPIPQRLQQNPEKPAEFNPLLGITFAFASTFSE